MQMVSVLALNKLELKEMIDAEMVEVEGENSAMNTVAAATIAGTSAAYTP